MDTIRGLGLGAVTNDVNKEVYEIFRINEPRIQAAITKRMANLLLKNPCIPAALQKLFKVIMVYY